MTDALIPVRITGRAITGRTAWADGLEVSVPREALQTVMDTRCLKDCGFGEVSSRRAMVDRVRHEACFTPTPPSSTRLPFSYQRVPGWARALVGRLIGRVQRTRRRSWAAFPRWPLDLSADFLTDLLDLAPSPFAQGPAPVLVSHDIDTPEGLRNLAARFLKIEEAVGARSSNYIVPCRWPIDHGLLGEVAGRGHEIGVHGYDHSNLTPFSPPEERRQRVAAASSMIERYGITGYRAPSLLRTPELIEELARFYRYDSSIPTSGGLFPVPNNGCASARPFRLGGLTEIPVTMPRDGSLRFLGHSPRDIVAIWRECAERIATSGGIITLLTHCERRFSGNPPMLEAYERFLEFLADDRRFVFASPAQVLARSEACDPA